MKDVIVKGNFLKRELKVFLACFIIAFGVNVYSIIAYNTEWLELLTALHIILLLAGLIYIVTGILRTIFWLIILPFRKRKKSEVLG
jgi:hypothetical protein